MKKKVLITGAAGFIGSHLANKLSETNEVYGLVHDHAWQSDRWTLLVGDVTNCARMLEIVIDCEIDQIFHLAAKSVVRNCRLDPVGCFNTNIMGTVAVLDAARQSERVSGVLVAESDKSYGNGPIPYTENQALCPGGIYEASKACAGYICRAYHHNFGVPAFSVRSANVYGPDDSQLTRLIPNTITRVLRGEQPQVTSGAEEFMREFIYVDDFVAYATALMELQPWGEVFNIGTGETNTVRGIVHLICELANYSFSMQDWPRPDTLTEIPTQQVSLDKLHKWVPDRQTLSLREGLQRTIEWYQKKLV